MKFTKGVMADEEFEYEEGLDGLEGIDPIKISIEEDRLSIQDPPILCFSGPARTGLHEDNCGRLVGWVVMGGVIASIISGRIWVILAYRGSPHGRSPTLKLEFVERAQV